MLCYLNTGKEIYLSMIPFIIPMFYILAILVVLNTLSQKDVLGPDTKQTVLSFAFPWLVTIGIVLSCGVFVFTPVIDREEKLRYLLNFAGMRSSSYYLGFLCADFIIFTVPQIFLGIMVFVLNLDAFKSNMFMFFLTIECFAFPYISLIYVLNFMFDKGETAYKFLLVCFMAIAILPGIMISIINVPQLFTVL